VVAAVKWYELVRISQSNSSKIRGVSLTEFLRIFRAYKVSIIPSDEDSLDRELE
jgi:hypothetical protein